MTTVDDGWFVEFRYYFDFKDEGTIKIQKGRITFFVPRNGDWYYY
jgi:hypothetical protein